MKLTLALWTLNALVLAAAVPAFSAEYRVTCEPTGTANSGARGLQRTEGELTFLANVPKKGLRTIREIEGRIQIADITGDMDNAYKGRFAIQKLTENPNYRPRKYKNYSQFEDFDATDTDGSAERGMWGTLLLEKSLDQGRAQARYIFQAGDHMGGTVHFDCRTSADE